MQNYPHTCGVPIVAWVVTTLVVVVAHGVDSLPVLEPYSHAGCYST